MSIFQDNQNYFSPLYMSKPLERQKQAELFSPQEAIMLGNLFKDLYMTYRGFSNYCLQADNPKQQALLEVQMYDFAAHELNLYLDTHPNDQQMLKLYQDYIQKAQEAKTQYEKDYGPLTVQDTRGTTPFDWLQGSWPWEYQK